MLSLDRGLKLKFWKRRSFLSVQQFVSGTDGTQAIAFCLLTIQNFFLLRLSNGKQTISTLSAGKHISSGNCTTKNVNWPQMTNKTILSQLTLMHCINEACFPRTEIPVWVAIQQSQPCQCHQKGGKIPIDIECLIVGASCSCVLPSGSRWISSITAQDPPLCARCSLCNVHTVCTILQYPSTLQYGNSRVFPPGNALYFTVMDCTAGSLSYPCRPAGRTALY